MIKQLGLLLVLLSFLVGCVPTGSEIIESAPTNTLTTIPAATVTPRRTVPPTSTIRRSASPTLWERLQQSKDHTIFAELIIRSNSRDLLNREGSFTLFAPVDSAFNSYGPETKDSLENLSSYTVRQWIAHHITEHLLPRARLFEATVNCPYRPPSWDSMNGFDLAFSSSEERIFVENAFILPGTIEAENGLIHPINQPLDFHLPATLHSLGDIIQRSEPQIMPLLFWQYVRNRTDCYQRNISRGVLHRPGQLRITLPIDSAFVFIYDDEARSSGDGERPHQAYEDALAEEHIFFPDGEGQWRNSSGITLIENDNSSILIGSTNYKILDRDVGNNGVIYHIDTLLVPEAYSDLVLDLEGQPNLTFIAYLGANIFAQAGGLKPIDQLRQRETVQYLYGPYVVNGECYLQIMTDEDVEGFALCRRLDILVPGQN